MAINTATATFSAVDTVTVTYTRTAASNPIVIAGDPVLTNPADAFVVVAVAGVPTSTSCTIKASAPFTGSVNVLVLD